MYHKTRALGGSPSAYPFAVYTGPAGSAVGCEEDFASVATLSNFAHLSDYYQGRRTETPISLLQGKEEISGTSNKKPFMNDVLHKRIREVRPLYSGFAYQFYYNNCYWKLNPKRGAAEYFYARRQASPNEMYTEYPVLSNSDLNLSAHAWHAMQPRFESGLSLINSLFELKDFRDVLRHLVHHRPWTVVEYFRKGLPRKTRPGIPINRERQPGPSVTDPSQIAASAVLTNQLAIEPLVRDILKLSSIIRDIVNEKQLEFGVAGTQRQKSHWSSAEVFHDDITITSYVSSFKFFNEAKGSVDKQKFTATMEYTYKYKCRDVLDAFQAYFGLSLDYNAIWNMLPFTFLWDYFNGVSESLRNMKHDGNVNLLFSQYCESVKRTKQSGTYIQLTYPGGIYSVPENSAVVNLDGVLTTIEAGDRIQVAGTEATTYSRRRCVPYYGPALPRWQIPSYKQLGTAAALLRTFL